MLLVSHVEQSDPGLKVYFVECLALFTALGWRSAIECGVGMLCTPPN